MAYFVGQNIGGIVLVYLLMRLILLAFRARKAEVASILISGVVALLIASILGGFGFANGNAPVFGYAFGTYIIPTIFAMAIELIRTRRLRAKSVA